VGGLDGRPLRLGQSADLFGGQIQVRAEDFFGG